MPTIPLHEVRRGNVIEHGGRHWLVLSGWMGPFPHGFYPPYEFTLQLLPTGPTCEVRLFGGRDHLKVMATEERVLEFVCRQQGELLLLSLASCDMVALPKERTDVEVAVLEPEADVAVRYFLGQPLWVLSLAEPGDYRSVGLA